MEKGDSFDYHQEVARSAFADMLHDTERNEKYSSALLEAINKMKSKGKKANVLDIGTGTGLLAMLAAQHGADSVVTIEAFSPVSVIARKIIESNGFKNQVKIVNKHSTEVTVGKGKDMEQKANILVAEVFDTELIGEGAIKTYNHAHQHLMDSDCICVPDSAAVYVQIVDSSTASGWFRNNSHGIPDNVQKCFGSAAIHDIQLSQFPMDKFTSLGGPLKICDVDFSGKSIIPLKEKFSKTFRAGEEGEAGVLFFWWELRMNPSGSILLSCAPHWSHPDTDRLAKSNDEVVRRNSIPWRDHWMQGCYRLEPSLSLEKKNDSAHLTAHHDEFSWWFSISRDLHDGSAERPACSCLLHVVNSRNRLMQLSDEHRIKDLLNFICGLIAVDGSCHLFVGDFFLMALSFGFIPVESSAYVLERDPLCHRLLKEFKESWKTKREKVIGGLDEIGDVEKITHVIAEPHFNSAVLPWDNFTIFWKLINDLKQRTKKKLTVGPSSAFICAIPVHFLNLHKIRWPLKSTCGGFDHQMFDEFIDTASSLADENVEPFTLWEYPCMALAPSEKIFEMNFNDGTIKTAKRTVDVKDFTKTCNGIAFFVNYTFGRGQTISCGPSSLVKPGELINWKLAERQAVHLIPCSKVEAGIVGAVEIETRFDADSERLAMDFTYNYKKSMKCE